MVAETRTSRSPLADWYAQHPIQPKVVVPLSLPPVLDPVMNRRIQLQAEMEFRLVPRLQSMTDRLCPNVVAALRAADELECLGNDMAQARRDGVPDTVRSAEAAVRWDTADFAFDSLMWGVRQLDGAHFKGITPATKEWQECAGDLPLPETVRSWVEKVYLVYEQVLRAMAALEEAELSAGVGTRNAGKEGGARQIAVQNNGDSPHPRHEMAEDAPPPTSVDKNGQRVWSFGDNGKSGDS